MKRKYSRTQIISEQEFAKSGPTRNLAPIGEKIGTLHKISKEKVGRGLSACAFTHL